VVVPTRILSVCSGIGGLDLGLKLALPGSTTVCYIERDSYAAATLVARMADQVLDHAPIWDNLRSFPVWRYRGRVDVVAGGIPCQPYSSAGLQLGADDGRDLWPDTLRLLVELGAGALFLENVARFTSNPDGLSRVLQQLAQVGFDARWGVFSCGALRASHVRKRLFLLAYTDSFKQRFKSRRGLWTGRPDQAFPQNAGETIPYTDCEQLQQTEWKDGRISIGDRQELADSQSQSIPRGRSSEEWDHNSESEVGGHQMGDTDGSGLAQERRRQEGSFPRRPSFWPPGPDPDVWTARGIDQRLWPGVPPIPDLCGVASGAPSWMVEANEFRADRLRSLGNLASPAVVYVALRVLLGRMLRGN